MAKKFIHPLPSSWSELSWQQLCDVWSVKQRYGGNADVARAAALLALCGLTVDGTDDTDALTGESIYHLTDGNGQTWTATARQIAHLAKQALQWLDYPYGDPGDKEEKDDKGNVVRERREGVRGLVNPDTGNWRDALSLNQETVTVDGHTFALPQVALNNLTWHQYRSLQAIAPQLFADGIDEAQALDLQAQWLAYCLVPEQTAKTAAESDTFRPEHTFTYQAERAEATVAFWRSQLSQPFAVTLFHICFQVYQTAMQNYYPAVYPMLFDGSGKSDPLHTALSGEVGTINAVMKYAGYSEQQQVYDTNVPIVFDILNTMTKEARQIEEINRKSRARKH